MHPATTALTLLLLLATSAAAPAQTVSNPDLFSKSLEVARHAIEQYGRYDNPEEERRINDIGYRVAKETGYDKFPFTFHLVDMPEPNAFALPGGQIFVTRGMLDLDLTDDMMAALLGHEIAHVVKEHSIQMQRKAKLMNILSQALMVGVLISADRSSNRRPGKVQTPYDYYGLNPNPAGNLVQGAAAASVVVNELLLRSYSRENESEADREGQRWAAAAGFDPAGASALMARMRDRIPQSKKYGYWMTHPFFEERVRSADDLAEILKARAPEDDASFREQTQAALLSYLDRQDAPKDAVPLVKDEALAAWPQGAAAEKLRLETLHAARDAMLADPQLSRDYGKVIALYEKQASEVGALTPTSPFLKTLAGELDKLRGERDDLYPKAVEVLTGGVYETSFLESFLSNFPEAPEVPRVALALGNAYSRLGNPTDAVRLYLEAWEKAPTSPEGQRAGQGLRNLAPQLEELAALQQLALQDRDPQLQQLAESRLEEVSKSFDDIDNGAAYLKRFPDGEVSDAVIERVNHLADDLYAEVLLYQAVGDPVKALERINKILTHAPTSPAAERLRDRAVLES